MFFFTDAGRVGQLSNSVKSTRISTKSKWRKLETRYTKGALCKKGITFAHRLRF
jgi:hypothetical protein